jgi:hypothetical protein
VLRDAAAERRELRDDPAKSALGVGVGVVQGDSLNQSSLRETYVYRSNDGRRAHLYHPLEPREREIVRSRKSRHIKDDIKRLCRIKHDLEGMVREEIVICDPDIGSDEIEYSSARLTRQLCPVKGRTCPAGPS